MRFLIVAILLVSVALGGCHPARIYTFKKDRVDQTMEGNRGYVMGTAPMAPAEKETPKRTMIGVDFEIGLLRAEKEKLKRKKPKRRKAEARVAEKKVVREEKEEAEERWIK